MEKMRLWERSCGRLRTEELRIVPGFESAFWSAFQKTSARRPAMKTRFSKIFPAILLTGVLTSCAPAYHEKEERYVFVAFNTSLPYWQEAAAGLEDSAKQLGVKAELTGPANFSTNEEVTAFQQAVGQKPAGILLSAANPETFRDPINVAIQVGIPVICVDADSPESKRITFVGTDNFRAGQESGRRMGDLLKGKGNVVIITIPGQYNLGERVRGVEDALKKYPGVKITKTIDDKGDSRIAYDMISPLLQGKDKLDGIIDSKLRGAKGRLTRCIAWTWTARFPSWRLTRIPRRWTGFSAERLPRLWCRSRMSWLITG